MVKVVDREIKLLERKWGEGAAKSEYQNIANKGKPE